MGFRDGGDSGEGGRAGVKGVKGERGERARKPGTRRRGRERGMNEGRTTMLRIGTKG